MVRRKALRRPAARAVSGDFRAPTRVVWLSAALLALLAPPVWAQYDPTQQETPGNARRAPQGGLPVPGGLKVGDGQGGKPAWQILPTLTVEETYTDNLRLTPTGSSDWVTRVMPVVSINGRGPRVGLNASYAPQLVDRAREGTRDIYQLFSARGDAELVQQLMFVDVQAANSRTNTSLLGPQTESTVNNTSNQSSVTSFLVSPYLRHNFGFDAQGEARLRYSTVSYNQNNSSSPNVYNSTANGAGLRLVSGPAFKLVTWDLAYDKERVDYTQSNQSVDTEKFTAGATRLITPDLRLRVNVGYEDNSYITAGPPPRGKFWSYGPEWTPTPRTRLAVTTGRAYYGPSHSLDFSHRTRLTQVHIAYTESVTTTRQNVLSGTTLNTYDMLDALFLSTIPDPVARQTAVNNFIILNGLPPTLTTANNIVATAPYLMKNLQVSFGINGVRNSVLGNVFQSTRESLGAAGQTGVGDFALNSTTKQTGASLLWTLRVTPQTASNVSVGYTLSEFPYASTNNETRYKFVRLGLNHQFGPRLSGNLNIRRVQSDSSQPGSDYTENAIMAAVMLRY